MSRRHLLIGLLCLAWIVPGLIGHEPWKSHETFNFGVIYDLLRGGSWLVPKLAGEPFLNEPPLYYLSAALTAYLASPLLPLHEGARLATGIYMALTLLFCGMAGRELNGKGSGATAALLLMGCIGLVMRGHEIITDIAPLAGFALVYYAWSLSLRRPAVAGLLLGVAAGVVFLSQGALETLIVIAISAVLPLVSHEWRNRRYAGTLAIAALLALPLIVAWPLALHAHSPALFAQWLQGDVYAIVRNTSAGGNEPRDVLFYLRIMPWHAWPVWALCLWQLWTTRREQLSTPAVALPLSGLVITLVLLSLYGGTRDLYALILLPPAALLSSLAIRHLPRGAANAWLWFGITGTTVFIIAAWVYWSGLELGVPARLHAHLHRLQPGYAPGFKPLPFAFAACYTIAWLVLLARLKRSPERPVIVWAAGVTVLWGLAATLFLGWVDTGRSYRTVFTQLQQNLPANYRCVASRNLGDTQRGMLHYYANVITRRVEIQSDHTQCDLLLIQGTARDATLAGPPWRMIWEGKRPGDKLERYRLYQRGT